MRACVVLFFVFLRSSLFWFHLFNALPYVPLNFKPYLCSDCIQSPLPIQNQVIFFLFTKPIDFWLHKYNVAVFSVFFLASYELQCGLLKHSLKFGHTIMYTFVFKGTAFVNITYENKQKLTETKKLPKDYGIFRCPGILFVFILKMCLCKCECECECKNVWAWVIMNRFRLVSGNSI